MRPAYVRVRRPPETRRGEKIYRADETKISSKLLTNLKREREEKIENVASLIQPRRRNL